MWKTVILFSDRKNAVACEIVKILTDHGAGYISDKSVITGKGDFEVISEYKKTELDVTDGIAVFIDDSERFSGQRFPHGMVGICEEANRTALELFMQSGIPVISCGMNSKNTVTLSSLNSSSLLTSLQRTLTDCGGKTVEPGEFKIKLTKKYHSFSVMAAAAVLLLNGITPDVF